ncbi:protein phosphatase 2C domain-containing protein [Streptacidiphilus sp. P02-A3a]|uniref:protein phosphatase 2C domain-containing protein n=1 Tax=Streptacidiphilus sp. P02-A3a TaxID=2704468 RepID=UPI0015FD625A|nr:protein phosphatase 2C domain-containing protein [Streptacidiphilus sp. P02-A3a]QMU69655.1 MerR family transcriptional regulator [Streptacidiphilus sp. P02-A3a]
MALLTIGAFAKESRLSPKALRLYDELGLLTPARVDPASGYRFYATEQLRRARLVAWLRRIGMPLARIRVVCALDDAAAAREVRAFWDQVEADTAARRELATFLIDHLSWKDPTMSPNAKPLEIRYAALSDAGLVRESNQDTAYAGSRLLAVADGFGRAGAPASAAAVDALKRLTSDGLPAGDLLNVLGDAIEQAKQAVRTVAAAHPEPQQVGTTLTAMLWTGSQLALVHIGDSRAYLLRDGEFFQITHDHTMVQAMVDAGRISADEAASHPQRSLLMRALAGESQVAADLRLHDAHPGDRYLLCSDGLSTVVATEELRRVVSGVADPEQAVRELVGLANRAGGPDNVSCVVADVLEQCPDGGTDR